MDLCNEKVVRNMKTETSGYRIFGKMSTGQITTSINQSQRKTGTVARGEWRITNGRFAGVGCFYLFCLCACVCVFFSTLRNIHKAMRLGKKEEMRGFNRPVYLHRMPFKAGKHALLLQETAKTRVHEGGMFHCLSPCGGRGRRNRLSR